jgi:hypothetical protein
MPKGDPRVPQKAPTASTPAPAPAPPPKAAAADKPAASARPAYRPAIKPARMPKGSSTPLTSRTATLDDPLTTSLLAEISRHPATVDVLPEQIAEAMDIARGDRDPDDST